MRSEACRALCNLMQRTFCDPFLFCPHLHTFRGSPASETRRSGCRPPGACRRARWSRVAGETWSRAITRHGCDQLRRVLDVRVAAQSIRAGAGISTHRQSTILATSTSELRAQSIEGSVERTYDREQNALGTSLIGAVDVTAAGLDVTRYGPAEYARLSSCR